MEANEKEEEEEERDGRMGAFGREKRTYYFLRLSSQRKVSHRMKRERERLRERERERRPISSVDKSLRPD
jgi:hypothetical protein